MTDNEIIKALELCNRPASETSCDDCPYQFSTKQCSHLLAKDTIDLINRQKAEIEKLEKVEHFADKTIATQQAEIERLQHTISELQHEIRCGNSIAIGKFAGKLESRLANNI